MFVSQQRTLMTTTTDVLCNLGSPKAPTNCQHLRHALLSGDQHAFSGVAPANQTKERPVHELFPGGKPWNKSSICESRLFSQGKTPELTKMGENHELFVLALFFGLVCRGDS